MLHILCENKNDFYHQQPTLPILVNPVGPASELKLQKLLDYPLRKLSLLALNALLWSFNHDLQIVLQTSCPHFNYKVGRFICREVTHNIWMLWNVQICRDITCQESPMTTYICVKWSDSVTVLLLILLQNPTLQYITL